MTRNWKISISNQKDVQKGENQKIKILIEIWVKGTQIYSMPSSYSQFLAYNGSGTLLLNDFPVFYQMTSTQSQIMFFGSVINWHVYKMWISCQSTWRALPNSLFYHICLHIQKDCNTIRTMKKRNILVHGFSSLHAYNILMIAWGSIEKKHMITENSQPF